MPDKPFDPGSARHPIRILKPHKSKDAMNADTITLVPFATIRASVRSTFAREQPADAQRMGDAEFMIGTQYIAGVEREMIISYKPDGDDELLLNIFDVEDPTGRREQLVIYAGRRDAR